VQELERLQQLLGELQISLETVLTHPRYYYSHFTNKASREKMVSRRRLGRIFSLSGWLVIGIWRAGKHFPIGQVRFIRIGFKEGLN